MAFKGNNSFNLYANRMRQSQCLYFTDKETEALEGINAPRFSYLENSRAEICNSGGGAPLLYHGAHLAYMEEDVFCEKYTTFHK